MAELYSVFHAKTKEKLKVRKKPECTGNKHQCERYISERKHTVRGFFEIRAAEEGSKTDMPSGKWKSGYVSGGRFEQHT